MTGPKGGRDTLTSPRTNGPVSFHRPPRPEFAPLIESLGYFDGVFAHRRERVLPSGNSQLLINLAVDRLETYTDDGQVLHDSTAGAALSGVRGSSTVIDGGGRCALLIVNFHPGGSYPFFGAPASATSDQLVALESLWKTDGATLRERLFEASTPEAKLDLVEAELSARVVAPLVPEPRLSFAINAVHDGAPISAVSERLGLSSKRFVQYFSDRVGLTPKRFGRVRRLQRSIGLIERTPTVDWADLAARCGFFDQAHLIHDFRALTGITPTEYRSAMLGDRNHLVL